jgi:hypothetical protein
MNTNYQNGKIYKIVDNTSDMIYVGSTYKTLQQRLKTHEINFKAFKANKQKFVTSFKIIENNNYKIELIKLYPCENKKALNLEEGKILKKLKMDGFNIINRNIAGLTHKESMSQYYQNNKIEFQNKARLKYNCQCGGKYTQCSKAHHEKSKKHQDYINNTKTINNHGTINITINVNNLEDLKNLELEFLNAIKN